jgi:beta-galactosidase
MLYIAHELTQSSDPDVVIYSNCDAVRLTWLGRVVGTQKPDSRFRHLPHPPFTFTNVFHFSEINHDWRERTGNIEMVAEGLVGGQVAVRVVKKYPERTTGVRVAVDEAGCGLTADGSDFVPVRATIVDNKGVPKVLAEEYVYFEVEGPGEIVSSPLSHTLPVRTEFGTATVLLRAKYTAGVIRIHARVAGLKSGDAYVVAAPPALSLDYDAAYAAASRPPATGGQVVLHESGGTERADVKALQERVEQLQRELTSKEQDLQDLRGKLK